jgi:hypothetical protein
VTSSCILISRHDHVLRLLDNAHKNQIESKEEHENEPPDIVDTEPAIQSMTNTKAPLSNSKERRTAINNYAA